MTLIEVLETWGGALTVQQVAELLGVSDKHIYELAADGALPAFRVGRAIRFDPQDLADWLRKKKPSDERNSSRILPRPEGSKSNQSGRENASLAQMWRHKVSALEVGLAMNTSSDGDSVKNS